MLERGIEQQPDDAAGSAVCGLSGHDVEHWPFPSWLGTLCSDKVSYRLSIALAGQLIVAETLAALGWRMLPNSRHVCHGSLGDLVRRADQLVHLFALGADTKAAQLSFGVSSCCRAPR